MNQYGFGQLLGGLTGTITTGNAQSMQAMQNIQWVKNALPEITAPPRLPNQDWLDQRINEIRVRL